RQRTDRQIHAHPRGRVGRGGGESLTSDTRLPFADVLAISAPALSMGGLAVAFQVYLPPYYASHVGLGAAGVADLFFIVRAIDIGVDPLIGMVMDRTRTRLGRYRAWLIGGPPLSLLRASVS